MLWALYQIALSLYGVFLHLGFIADHSMYQFPVNPPCYRSYQPHAFLPNDTNYNVENVAFLDLYGVQHKGIFYRLIQNSIESKYANINFEFFKIANI